MAVVVYALDDGANKWEAMTKEQILTAIMQAVNEGTIGDIDSGFVTTIKEMNHQEGVRLWIGTMSEYQALGEKDPNTIYLFSDDPTIKDIEDNFIDINNRIDNLEQQIEGLDPSPSPTPEPTSETKLHQVTLELSYITTSDVQTKCGEVKICLATDASGTLEGKYDADDSENVSYCLAQLYYAFHNSGAELDGDYLCIPATGYITLNSTHYLVNKFKLWTDGANVPWYKIECLNDSFNLSEQDITSNWAVQSGQYRIRKIIDIVA